MEPQHELPEWLEKLAGDVWDDAEWKAWETFRRALAEHGVTPVMLFPHGDADRPTIIEVRRPSLGWLSANVNWDEDGEKNALLLAVQRLALKLDARAAPRAE